MRMLAAAGASYAAIGPRTNGRERALPLETAAWS
jgi:hypothetical protein